MEFVEITEAVAAHGGRSAECAVDLDVLTPIGKFGMVVSYPLPHGVLESWVWRDSKYSWLTKVEGFQAVLSNGEDSAIGDVSSVPRIPNWHKRYYGEMVRFGEFPGVEPVESHWSNVVHCVQRVYPDVSGMPRAFRLCDSQGSASRPPWRGGVFKNSTASGRQGTTASPHLFSPPTSIP